MRKSLHLAINARPFPEATVLDLLVLLEEAEFALQGTLVGDVNGELGVGFGMVDKCKLGVTEASERLCQTLPDSKQIIPRDTIFRDDIFHDICGRLRSKNEVRMFKDCTPLIVP